MFFKYFHITGPQGLSQKATWAHTISWPFSRCILTKWTQGWGQRNQLSSASKASLKAFTVKQSWILRKHLTDKIGEYVVLGICFYAGGNKNGRRYLKHFSASWAASWNSCYLRLHLCFPTMKIKCIATGKEIFGNLSNCQPGVSMNTVLCLKFFM